MQSEGIIKAAIESDPSMTREQRERILAAMKPQPPAPAPPETLSRLQAAKIFGVHPGSLKRWEKSGKLRPIKITPRCLRYNKSEVLALLGGVPV